MPDQTLPDPFYVYIGELYGSEPGQVDTLSGWNQTFANVCNALNTDYPGIYSTDDGITYRDVSTGETLLMRLIIPNTPEKEQTR